MGVPLRVGQVDVSMGNCSLKTVQNMGKSLFFVCFGVFLFLNLSRLCWEQVLWRNSAFSCGHCIRGRGVFLLMIPQLGYPKVFRRNA